jgi:hypothetical protein
LYIRMLELTAAYFGRRITVADFFLWKDALGI